jgi:hypothetical protein
MLECQLAFFCVEPSIMDLGYLLQQITDEAFDVSPGCGFVASAEYQLPRGQEFRQRFAHLLGGSLLGVSTGRFWLSQDLEQREFLLR